MIFDKSRVALRNRVKKNRSSNRAKECVPQLINHVISCVAAVANMLVPINVNNTEVKRRKRTKNTDREIHTHTHPMEST